MPQKPKIATGTQGGSSGGGSQGERGLVCPASFRADLNHKLVLGSRLTLKQDDGVLMIQAGSREVGRLGHTLSKKIGDCISSGYRYEGVVKEDNGRQYAEFVRK